MLKQNLFKNFIIPKSVYIYHSFKLASIFMSTVRGIFILKMPSIIYFMLIK
jgi:hypothetical protein